MQIYTKTGDAGETSLLGGKRVQKNCIEIDAIGEVDELNSYLGVLISFLEEPKWRTEKEKLIQIQHHLFNVGGMIAAVQTDLVNVPTVGEVHVQNLETWIDAMTKELPELTQFILPGGHRAAAVCYHTRAVCRRAERRVVELQTASKLNPVVQHFLNRLSDALFTLGRYINVKEGHAEVTWRK